MISRTILGCFLVAVQPKSPKQADAMCNSTLTAFRSEVVASSKQQLFPFSGDWRINNSNLISEWMIEPKLWRPETKLSTVVPVSWFPMGLPSSRTCLLNHSSATAAGFPPCATDRPSCSHFHPQHVASVILGKIQTQPGGGNTPYEKENPD